MKQNEFVESALKMLDDNYQLIFARRNDKRDALMDLLSYIAYLADIETVSTPSMPHYLHDQIKNGIDLELLKNVGGDIIGDFYKSLNITPGLSLIPHATIDSFVELYRKDYDSTKPLRFLDRNIGSGRMFIEMNKEYGDRILYYGAEPDEIAYRIALINMKLFNVPARILHADKTIDLSPGSPNWKQVNMWYPISMKYLKAIN